MTDETTTAPAIFGALVRVQAELGSIERDGRGPSSQGAYPFMRVDTIVARIGPLLTEHGIAVIGNQVECEQVTYRFPKVNMEQKPVYDGRPDAFQIITRLRYEFTFISAADGSSVTAAAYGESADTGDKGIRRAATAAYKEVLLRVFTIVSGDEDPDQQDPNDQPAAVVRQNRGEQQRERAGRGKTRTERAPRAARGTQAADDESTSPTPEPEQAAEPEPEEQPAAEEQPAPQPEKSAQPTAAERRAAASASRASRVREEKPAAEQRSEDWKVDPADVKAAEAVEQPPAREPQQPLAKPEPETQADEKYNSVADIRTAIRSALQARGLDRDYANELGDQVTGKQRGQWFASLPDLRKVLKAIEAGEAPDDAEAGF